MGSHHLRVPLRWVDLDAQGHVNNAAVVDYLQEARVDFLLTGSNAHLLGNGIIVVGHQVEYLGAITHDEQPLDVVLDVGEVGAARLTVGYTVHQAGRLVARARTVLATYDFVARRPLRMTDPERAWFADRSTPLEPLRDLPRIGLGERHHVYPFPVRWSDLDAYGHVNNTRFFDYVAEARVALNAGLVENSIRVNPHDAVERSWLVARQDLRYVGQIGHRLAPYEVRTSIGPVGRTSVTLAAEIVDPIEASVLARSTTVLVHGDAHGVPQPLPAAMLAAAERWPVAPARQAVV